MTNTVIAKSNTVLQLVEEVLVPLFSRFVNTPKDFPTDSDAKQLMNFTENNLGCLIHSTLFASVVSKKRPNPTTTRTSPNKKTRYPGKRYPCTHCGYAENSINTYVKSCKNCKIPLKDLGEHLLLGLHHYEETGDTGDYYNLWRVKVKVGGVVLNPPKENPRNNKKLRMAAVATEQDRERLVGITATTAAEQNHRNDEEPRMIAADSEQERERLAGIAPPAAAVAEQERERHRNEEETRRLAGIAAAEFEKERERLAKEKHRIEEETMTAAATAEQERERLVGIAAAEEETMAAAAMTVTWTVKDETIYFANNADGIAKMTKYIVEQGKIRKLYVVKVELGPSILTTETREGSATEFIAIPINETLYFESIDKLAKYCTALGGIKGMCCQYFNGD